MELTRGCEAARLERVQQMRITQGHVKNAVGYRMKLCDGVPN